MEKHIDYVKSKISKTVAILNKIGNLLNKKALFMLYASLFVPYLTYCLEIWGNTFKTYTQPLFILQKRALRIITKSQYRDHTNDLFLKLNILKFYDLVDYKVTLIMYKVYYKMLPDKILSMFEKRYCRYELKGICLFKKLKVRTNTRCRTISVRGVNLWNCLHTDLKLTQTISGFKRLLRNKMIFTYR